jgi:hypothetical protein
LANEPRSNVPADSPVQSAGSSVKAEKVRSSRYEWEGKSAESEKGAGAASGMKRSLLASARALLKKFISRNRGSGGRGFFDNDDDPSPSAA